MSTILKVKVEELDDRFIENMKREFAHSDLEIHVIEQAGAAEAFTEEDFWELLNRLDWTDESDDDRIVEPVVEALTQHPLAHIYRFADILSEKLWHLDTQKHAQVFLDDPELEGYLSVDDFLYARCAVVANGKEFYYQVLKEPSKMPLDLTYEPLLFIAGTAYERKTGKQFMGPPTFNYETYSNEDGWVD